MKYHAIGGVIYEGPMSARTQVACELGALPVQQVAQHVCDQLNKVEALEAERATLIDQLRQWQADLEGGKSTYHVADAMQQVLDALTGGM